MKVASRNANLRAVLADDDDVRETVHEMINVMETVEKEDARGFRLASLLNPDQPVYADEPRAKPFQLGNLEYQLLRRLVEHTADDRLRLFSRQARAFDEISIRGVRYSTSQGRKFRDSNIIFQLPGIPSNMNTQRAGSIDSIFGYTWHSTNGQSNEYYLSVREHPPFDDSTIDPYRRYPFAGGFLCKASTKEVHIIHTSHVVSHFASTSLEQFGDDCLHALPLDRVTND
jgi:hypothetical protein